MFNEIKVFISYAREDYETANRLHDDLKASGLKPWMDKKDILLGHLENLYEFYGEFTGVRVARKHISWYSKGQSHGGAFRDAVCRVDTIDEQLSMTHEFFERLLEKEEIAA